MVYYLLALALVATVSADPIRLTKDVKPFPNGRIINGTNAFIETFPYQLSLQYFGSHICGASIISEKYALTAGHCVRRFRPGSMKVRSGSSFYRTGGKLHTVINAKLHENYYKTDFGVPNNDIAIIEVEEPFEFDDSQAPISLFERNDVSRAGEISVVTGWGKTEEDKLPSQLKSVSIPVISLDLCKEAYAEFGGIDAGQICASFYGEGGRDSCQGDSGGPMAINGRLAGVVSWGNGCARPDYPGVYTEVAYFRDWIEKNIRQDSKNVTVVPRN